MIFPKKLKKGDRVALVSPASPVPEERLAPAIAAVESYGLVPVVYESCRARRGYLSGSDELRASDLMEAFTDDSIDGIWCIRGGYGAQRLIERLDLEKIAAHPKFFGGYSDITALHVVLNQSCSMVTYHTPMPSTELYKPVDDYTADWVQRMLFGSLTGEAVQPDNMPLEKLTGGSAEGILVGGNLSLVVSSIGTPYEIDTRGKILFMEDVNEEPYRIDGMLQQMAASGKLREAAGIVLGYWTDCTTEHMEKSLTLREVFEDLIVPAGVPAVMNLACGHSLPSNCLPLGARVKLDADRLTLTIEEDGQ